jgi:hypothetical protein
VPTGKLPALQKERDAFLDLLGRVYAEVGMRLSDDLVERLEDALEIPRERDPEGERERNTT